jgi:hypothetical protein
MELEPDQEKEKDDPEIGDVEHLLRGADQAEAVGADDGSGDEIAQYCTQPEAAEQHDEDQGGSEDDDPVAEQKGRGLGARAGFGLHQ